MVFYRLPLLFLVVVLTSGAVVIARHQNMGLPNLGSQPALKVDARPGNVTPPLPISSEKKVEDPTKLHINIITNETSKSQQKISYLDRFSEPGSGSPIGSVASGGNEVARGGVTGNRIEPQPPNPAKPEDVATSSPVGSWRGLAVVIPVTSNLPNEGLAESPPGKVISDLLKQHPNRVKAWWMGIDGVLTPVVIGADAVITKGPTSIVPFPAGSPLQNLLEIASSRLKDLGHIVDGQRVEGILLWPGYQPPAPPPPADKLRARAGWSMVWMSPAASPRPALDTYFGRKSDDTTERFFPMNESPAGIALLLGQLIPGGGSTTP